MMHTVSINTDFGSVSATWRRKGDMIVVRYGHREKPAQASDNDATNGFVARNMLSGWIADDLKDGDK